MKWKAKTCPTVGETRTVTKFAWYPLQLDCGSYIWLEKYESVQYACENYHYNGRHFISRPQWKEHQRIQKTKLERSLK